MLTVYRMPAPDPVDRCGPIDGGVVEVGAVVGTARFDLGEAERHGEIRDPLLRWTDRDETGDCFSSDAEDLSRRRFVSRPVIITGRTMGGFA